MPFEDVGPWGNLPLKEVVWLRLYMALLSGRAEDSTTTAAIQADHALLQYENRFGTIR